MSENPTTGGLLRQTVRWKQMLAVSAPQLIIGLIGLVALLWWLA